MLTGFTRQSSFFFLVCYAKQMRNSVVTKEEERGELELLLYLKGNYVFRILS